MSTKFVMLDTVKLVEEKIAKQWLRGVGPEAKFADNSEGWYATFSSCPASMYLGASKPGLRAGDRVRLTMEKV
jgi:hypothetical protein